MSNQFNAYSEQFHNNYTEAENQAFTKAFHSLTEKFAQSMDASIPVSSEEVQALVKEHYDFCSQFWTPSRDAYKNLALSYIMPSPYRDTYENIREGLGQYHYDAIVIWADNNL